MELFTWVSAITSKAQFSDLIALTEKGALEELFIAQSVDFGVAGEEWPVGKPLIFSFSTSKDIEAQLNEISPCVNLDSLDDIHFEELDGIHTLKSVFYPESEAQEEQIIALLV